MSYLTKRKNGSWQSLSLGAVGESLSFANGVEAANDAFKSLSLRARALYVAATSLAIQGEAEQAIRFAEEAGPIGLQKAVQNADVDKLRSLQKATANITQNVSEDLMDSVIERFQTANILPPSATENLKELLRTVDPPGPKTTPWYIYAGVGLGAAVAIAYVVRSFK